MKWISPERLKLPVVLLGQEIRYDRKLIFDVPNQLVKEHGFALCFDSIDELLVGSTPLALVVDEVSSEDLFSWIKAYVPEIFPLNHFIRVITFQDWEKYGEKSRALKDSQSVSMKWSNIILGEIMGLFNSSQLKEVPYSWMSACLTATVGRGVLLHNSEEVVHEFGKRLQVIEYDNRFVKRSISTECLLPIWHIATINEIKISDLPSLCEFVIRASFKARDSIGSAFSAEDILEFLFHKSDFFGDSIEKRVGSFYKLVEIVSSKYLSTKETSIPGAILAVGAFLVGRGTSHISLLRKAGDGFSCAFPWFGLIAAIGGIEYWDPIWIRSCKGAEKVIRGGFTWNGPSSADLSWCEYVWIENLMDHKSQYVEYCKYNPKNLTIEVIPGAICQLRLSGDMSISTSDTQINGDVEKKLIVKSKELINSVIGLTAELRNVICEMDPASREFLGEIRQESFLDASNRKKRQKRVKLK